MEDLGGFLAISFVAVIVVCNILFSESYPESAKGKKRARVMRERRKARA